MPSVTAHTYINTRVSIMAARLLSKDRLAELSGQSLEEISRHFQIDALLDETLSVSSKNRAVERALVKILLQDFSVLLRPLAGKSRKLAAYWARKFELNNLKALIRGKLSNMPEQDIAENLYDLPADIAMPYTELLQTESILELLRRLEQGPYSTVARQARKVYEERHEPFSLEATIDQQYYTGLVKRARETSARDRKPLQEVIGAVLDQLDLQWLLRYRFAYQLSPSETYYQLVPSCHAMRRPHLLTLVDLDGFEQVLEQLPGGLSTLLQNAETPTEVEHRLDHRTMRIVSRALKYSSSTVTRVLSYLILRELEQKKVFALIQGKILGLNDELIRFAMGCDQAPESSGAKAA